MPGNVASTCSISGVSVDSGKGRHTTRVAEMLPLACGGWVIDTPGIRQLELWDVIPEQVEGYFREFRPFVARCKFPDCSHLHETGCAVRSAVDDGQIARVRYASASGNWELSVFANNLTDEVYANYATRFGGGFWDATPLRSPPTPAGAVVTNAVPERSALGNTMGRPREYGVTFQYNFGRRD